jgi:hypothetical protein
MVNASFQIQLPCALVAFTSEGAFSPKGIASPEGIASPGRIAHMTRVRMNGVCRSLVKRWHALVVPPAEAQGRLFPIP